MPCPVCSSETTEAFYRAQGVPANSVLTLRSREEALAFPRGDIELHHCSSCGFVFNAAFDPALVEYSTQYEETQGYSGTFRAFELELAEDLVRRHDLHHKRIVEIGCGKGEFLALLCRLGPNHGVGYDPAFVPARRPPDAENVEYIAEFFGDGCRLDADFVYSKMTLEHIAEPTALLRTIRAAVGESSPTLAIQVPDWNRIAQETAFWDVYYEHCSYFTAASLEAAFRAAGFRPTRRESLYGGQYVSVEGVVGSAAPSGGVADAEAIQRFAADAARAIERRRRMVLEAAECGPVALWGGGSKAVAFLTTLGLRDEVAAVVDINPYRQQTFTAGSGHPIVAPEALCGLRPAAVFVMNPIYEPEIRSSLAELGVDTQVIAVG